MKIKAENEDQRDEDPADGVILSQASSRIADLERKVRALTQSNKKKDTRIAELEKENGKLTG